MSDASWLSSRRRRARPHNRYSGRDRTSSATNIVSRSFDDGNSIMPPIANMSSGKTSVCVTFSATSSCSCWVPGATEPAGAKPPPSSRLRSAATSTPGMASTRIAPWRKSAGPSTAIAPITATPRSPAITISEISAATSPAMDRPSWVSWRNVRGMNASRSTPRTATPNTMSIGASSRYSTDGVWNSAARVTADEPLIPPPLPRPAPVLRWLGRRRPPAPSSGRSPG